MSDIDIRQDHALSDEQAHAAINEVASKLDARFGLHSHWNGERLEFSGSGVDGVIELLPGQVRVTATLGFLLSAMKGMAETEIRRVLAEKLSGA